MTTRRDAPRTKVARVIEKYDLSGMGSMLEDAWVGKDGERKSLRSLADEFNERVLEESLHKIGASSLNIDVESTYEALQTESNSDKTRAKRRLEREGVDLKELNNDFVTHQAIHTYLKRNRGVKLQENEEVSVGEKIKTLEKLQGRVRAVTESAISTLASANQLDRDDYEVLIDVRVICPVCNLGLTVNELFRNGGCNCEHARDRDH